jgi:hypothetical protein
MSITACEQHGTAHKAPETPGNQEEPNNRKAQETLAKQEEPNNRNGEQTEWLEYWPAVVELEGKLRIETFFGPPNFGEDPETDSKEITRILSLDKPIKIRSRDETDSVLGPSVENVRELQLIFDGHLRKSVGKRLIVKGTLLHAHTGHHHTDVILDVESIRLAPSD